MWTQNELELSGNWIGALLLEHGVDNLHSSLGSVSEQSFEKSANKWTRKLSTLDISSF